MFFFFPVYFYQPLTLWKKFGHNTLLYSDTAVSVHWGLCAFLLCTALIKTNHIISIIVRSGLQLVHCNILILFFFSCSAVDSLLCLGSLSYCPTSFSWRTNSLRFDSMIFSDCEVPIFILLNITVWWLHVFKWLHSLRMTSASFLYNYFCSWRGWKLII